MNKEIGRAFLVLVSLASSAVYGDVMVTLTPSSAISGQPGQSVGWGFTIDNDTSNYILFDSSNFCGVGGDPDFTDCSGAYNGITEFGPSYGTYDDFIANNGTTIAPNASLSQTFDATLQTGVGTYIIDPGALPGSVDMGNIYLSFESFSGPPSSDDQVAGPCGSGDCEIFAAATVTVTGTSAVPEPGSLTLTAIAVTLSAWIGVTRRKRPWAGGRQ
jgi:hypothetical protein